MIIKTKALKGTDYHAERDEQGIWLHCARWNTLCPPNTQLADLPSPIGPYDSIEKALDDARGLERFWRAETGRGHQRALQPELQPQVSDSEDTARESERRATLKAQAKSDAAHTQQLALFGKSGDPLQRFLPGVGED